MASLQDIRRRIKSIKSIEQITNAMHMVATSRLRHAKEVAAANEPYARKVSEIVQTVAQHAGDATHPLLQKPEKGKKLVLVLAADKGLAGAYSSNVLKEAVRHIENREDTENVAVGRKARDFLKYRKYGIVTEFTGFSERPTYEDARRIAWDLIDRFSAGEVREVHIVYTRFISAINCVPETVRLLPFEAGESEVKGPQAEYIFEPSAEEVLAFLLPQYIVTTIYEALLQSAASELSSRMNAMSNATENAAELISKLALNYNKVRQAGITREITEIVGGAEALK